MKYFLMAAGFVVALGFVQTPVHAQNAEEIRRICNNKYGLGKNAATASEAQRKEAGSKIAACIRSGGKS